MASIAKIQKTSSKQFTAYAGNGEAVGFITREEEGLIRVDYELPYGWEDECFSGDFDALNEKEAGKIFGNYLYID